jgi:glycosyltransferase involved in cell wall biosynthesis
MLQILNPLDVTTGWRSSRRLRILQILPHYYPAVRYGGPIRSVHALARDLAARGHEVHVFTSSMDGEADLPIPVGAAMDLDGVKVRYFPVRWPRRLCRCPAMQKALRREVHTFDVVHMHSVFQWPTFAAARAAAASGVPYLSAPRGMLGHAVIQAKSAYIKSAWIRLIERRTLREAAGLHVTSDVEAREIGALGLPLPKVFCVPNSVTWPAEPRTIAQTPYVGLPKDYILFLSRIDPKKGLDRLIEAAQFFEQPVVIAGNEESGYGAHLRRRVAQLKLERQVHFIGAVADEHKWALYQNAGLFILPSKSENFGNVVAEAMAMGCPVITTPDVGLAELVQEYEAGVVCEATPATLAAAVRRLMRDSSLRAAMGQRARAAVIERLSPESVVRKMESVYFELADRRSSGLLATG